MTRRDLLTTSALTALASSALGQDRERASADVRALFEIRVVDKETGRGVPLVEVRTVGEALYVTDSAGRVAVQEPGLMNRRVFFYLSSHGYRFPKDGFGYEGTALDLKPGGSATLKIERVSIAERLYRVTGEGIYRDSVLLGKPVPIAHPLLNGGVLGQDSVQAALYHGKAYWIWGDTNFAGYPLGLFKSSGATSAVPGPTDMHPDIGIDLDYFVGLNDQSRAMLPTPDTKPVWIDGMAAVPDDTGAERLVARYSRMKDLGTTLEQGLAVFDDAKSEFVRKVQWDVSERWRLPRGHPFVVKDSGAEFLLFPAPFATTRVKRTLATIAEPAAYEAFTCLKPRARWAGAETPVERDAAGHPVWEWKRDTDPLTQQQERELIAAGNLPANSARFQVRDADTGKEVLIHGGSIRWNAWRRRWIMIAVQSGGDTSYLGEVWYAEALAPTGPWSRAKRIVTHNRYTFYNPVHHDFMDERGGRIVHFEGTYANTFSGNPVKTPRYDYNQVMYRLDLSDARLAGAR